MYFSQASYDERTFAVWRNDADEDADEDAIDVILGFTLPPRFTKLDFYPLPIPQVAPILSTGESQIAPTYSLLPTP